MSTGSPIHHQIPWNNQNAPLRSNMSYLAPHAAPQPVMQQQNFQHHFVDSSTTQTLKPQLPVNRDQPLHHYQFPVSPPLASSSSSSNQIISQQLPPDWVPPASATTHSPSPSNNMFANVPGSHFGPHDPSNHSFMSSPSATDLPHMAPSALAQQYQFAQKYPPGGPQPTPNHTPQLFPKSYPHTAALHHQMQKLPLSATPATTLNGQGSGPSPSGPSSLVRSVTAATSTTTTPATSTAAATLLTSKNLASDLAVSSRPFNINRNVPIMASVPLQKQPQASHHPILPSQPGPPAPGPILSSQQQRHHQTQNDQPDPQTQIQALALARGTAVIRLLHYAELVASSGPQIHDVDFWKRLVAEFFNENCIFKFTVDSGKEIKSADIPYHIIARFFHAFVKSGVSKIQLCLENIREYPAGPPSMISPSHLTGLGTSGNTGPGHFIDCSRCYVNYWYSDGTMVTSRCPLRVLMNSNFKIEWMEQHCAQHAIYTMQEANNPVQQKVDITPFGVTASMMRFIEMAETISHMRDLMQYSTNPQLGGPINSLKSLVNALKSRDLSAKPSPAPGPGVIPDMSSSSSPHTGYVLRDMPPTSEQQPQPQPQQQQQQQHLLKDDDASSQKRRRPSSLSQPPKSAT